MDWFVNLIGDQGLLPLFRALVVALVALPLVAAAAVAASGRAARRVALTLAVVELGLAALLVLVGARPVLADRGAQPPPDLAQTPPRFNPEFVPGAPDGASN